jgi:hypothetical protein
VFPAETPQVQQPKRERAPRSAYDKLISVAGELTKSDKRLRAVVLVGVDAEPAVAGSTAGQAADLIAAYVSGAKESGSWGEGLSNNTAFVSVAQGCFKMSASTIRATAERAESMQGKKHHFKCHPNHLLVAGHTSRSRNVLTESTAQKMLEP